MSSRADTDCWRRAVAILIAVFSLTLAGPFAQSTAAPVASRDLAGNTSAAGGGTPPLVLANWGWGGCWRCGGFADFDRRFFFHRPFFARDRFFFHRRFARPFFFSPFDNRFAFIVR